MARFEINSKNVPPDLEPDESITLWRYMSFTSLCEILMNDHISLISVRNFSDKSEGAILKEILSKLPNTNRNSIEHTMQIYLESIHVSSWHNAKDENAAMWDRYTHGGEGVAIKTNAKLLLDCIPDIEIKESVGFIKSEKGTKPEKICFPPKVLIKPIKYTGNKPSDFEMTEEQLEKGHAKLCFFYKMDDYKDESEIRILRSSFDNAYTYAREEPFAWQNLWQDVFQNMERDLNITPPNNNLVFANSFSLQINSASKLIQQIVVSPHAHNQFIETVKQAIRHINFCRDSVQSPLIDPNIVIESRRKDWV